MSHWQQTVRRTIRNYNALDTKYFSRGALKHQLLEKLKTWTADISQKSTKKRGPHFQFPDILFQYTNYLHSRYHDSYRELSGEMEPICNAYGFHAPHYSVLHRRGAKIDMTHFLSSMIPVKSREIATDSSGMKTTSRGDWLRHAHGTPRKGWLKFHIAVDVEDQMIVAAGVTTEHVHDSSTYLSLLDQAQTHGPVKKDFADKGYDSGPNFEGAKQKGTEAVILPRRNARTRARKSPIRGNVVWMIHHYGRDKWKISSGYNRRCAVERTFAVFKKLFGETLMAKKWGYMVHEMRLKMQIYNAYILTTKFNSPQ